MFSAGTNIVTVSIGTPGKIIQVKPETSDPAADQVMIRNQQRKALNVTRLCKLLNLRISRRAPGIITFTDNDQR